MDQERSIIRELLGWIVYILIIVGLTYVIITFVGQRTRVSGSSMEISVLIFVFLRRYMSISFSMQRDA